ncbi:bile acid:sodium symporter family protein [bacterium]|nr:bile acid:sodium symporter family protein [bacterium]
MDAVDSIRLSFNPQTLTALNVILAFVMFGVALDLRVDDFRRVARDPKGPAIGLVCQILFLPAATYLLTRAIDPAPSIALGMILVASCPGGNISNFVTHLAGGNTALSVSMTAVSTAVAVAATPFNFALWGSMAPETASILRAIEVSPWELASTVLAILGLPLAVGMLVAAQFPAFAARAHRPMKIFAIGFFSLFIVAALVANVSQFMTAMGFVLVVVAAHNSLALGLGYAGARLFGLQSRDRRAVAIEVGMQNSALGLALVFNFFDGLGGMAVICAWWGVWHLVSGLSLALGLAWRDRRAAAASPS